MHAIAGLEQPTKIKCKFHNTNSAKSTLYIQRKRHSPRDDTRSACLDRMQRVGCRHLPVLDHGRLVAMLSMRDLLRDEIEEQHEEIQGLRAYLHQTPI